MKRIKQLSENLINQIAAGEAIERPASIVKELVENSIDAGSTRIEIEISNSTRDIRVADNGSGIHKDDILLAFSRHATSKIQTQEDLWSIYTLGFRGEALSSIISVAKVGCSTRTADSETGYKIKCENSQVSFSEAGCAIGTIMEVKDLFYNVPARLKFLKKDSTELAAISEIVQNLAISNPQIAFTLISKKNAILKTSGTNDLSSTIGEIYSNEIIKELNAVNKTDAGFGLTITGFASNPDCARSNKKAIHTFINGRTVKCPILLKAIDNAYSDLIPSGKYPYVVLNISMPPDELDVNVHPTKKEVKYTKPNLVFNFVYSAVKSALEQNSKVTAYAAATAQKSDYSFETEYESREPVSDYRSETTVIAFPGQFSREFAPTEPAKKQENYTEPTQAKLEIETDGYEMFFEKPKIIGQLENTYILVQLSEGLQIIDQHIAHERYLYEKLQHEKTHASQLVLDSTEIEAEAEQLSLFSENSPLLEKHGYSVEITANGVKLKRIPQAIAEKDPAKIIENLIDVMQTASDRMENELLIRTSCLCAVKAGEKLSVWQMEELVLNWQKTSYPRTCPHGRKIAHVIPIEQIASFFGRQL